MMFSYSLPASQVSVLAEGDLFHLRGALARDRVRLEHDLSSLDEVSAPLVAPVIREHMAVLASLLERLDNAAAVLVAYSPLDD